MPVAVQDVGIYIGIDPGKNGGLVGLYGKEIYYTSMPDTERGIWSWLNQLLLLPSIDPSEPCMAVIEEVSTSPQMGVKSAGTFMYNYGQLRMALTGLAIPFELIRPQIWQKGLSIAQRKKGDSDTQWKKKLKAAAQRLFPKLEIWSQPRSEGRQLAIADALLIAEFCRRKHKGILV